MHGYGREAAECFFALWSLKGLKKCFSFFIILCRYCSKLSLTLLVGADIVMHACTVEY